MEFEVGFVELLFVHVLQLDGQLTQIEIPPKEYWPTGHGVHVLLEYP